MFEPRFCPICFFTQNMYRKRARLQQYRATPCTREKAASLSDDARAAACQRKINSKQEYIRRRGHSAPLSLTNCTLSSIPQPFLFNPTTPRGYLTKYGPPLAKHRDNVAVARTRLARSRTKKPAASTLARSETFRYHRQTERSRK